MLSCTEIGLSISPNDNLKNDQNHRSAVMHKKTFDSQ